MPANGKRNREKRRRGRLLRDARRQLPLTDEERAERRQSGRESGHPLTQAELAARVTAALTEKAGTLTGPWRNDAQREFRVRNVQEFERGNASLDRAHRGMLIRPAYATALRMRYEELNHLLYEGAFPEGWPSRAWPLPDDDFVFSVGATASEERSGDADGPAVEPAPPPFQSRRVKKDRGVKINVRLESRLAWQTVEFLNKIRSPGAPKWTLTDFLGLACITYHERRKAQQHERRHSRGLE